MCRGVGLRRGGFIIFQVEQVSSMDDVVFALEFVAIVVFGEFFDRGLTKTDGDRCRVRRNLICETKGTGRNCRRRKVKILIRCPNSWIYQN